MLFFFFLQYQTYYYCEKRESSYYKMIRSFRIDDLVDDSVGFRDMPTAHAFKGTYWRRTKVEHDSDSTTNLAMKIQS